MQTEHAFHLDATVPAVALPGGLDRADPHRARALVRGAWLAPVLAAILVVAGFRAGIFLYEVGVIRPDAGPIALLTNQHTVVACPLARGGGRLVVVEGGGLGVKWEDWGPRQAVRWPAGSSARFEHGRAVLIGTGGGVIAVEGDYVAFGGAGGPDAFFACTDVHRVAPDLWH